MGGPPPLGRVVHADQVGAEERDLLLDQPCGRLRRHERPLLGEAGLAPVVLDPRPDQQRRAGLNRAPRGLGRSFEIGDRDRLAVPLVGEIQQMAGQHQALQRHVGDVGGAPRAMARHIQVGAAMLRHQEHAGFHRDLAAADRLQIVEGADRPEGHGRAADVRHVVEHFPAEIDDLLRHHGHCPSPLS